MKSSGNSVYLSKRLIDRMDECFKTGIAVLRAPAGFGKSVCTDEYFRRCVSAMARVYWLTCDGLSPMEISAKFCQYVSAVDPEAGQKLKALEVLTAANAHQVGAILRSAKCELPTWLVFDRIEALPEDFRSCCADFSAPDDKNLHLVVMTREKLNIDAPSITAADLALSQEEIGEMFESEGIKLKPRELAAVYRYTSGWLTAVSLVIEYIELTGKMPESADTDALIGTLYDDLPREKRMALRRLCYFSRLTPAKVQFLLEEREINDDTREFFRTFPLIRYSTREECWYLHEILSNYIIANSCDVVALARSAAWYSQTGAPGKAVSCYYSRLDYEGVLSVDFVRLDPEEDICGKPFIQVVRELAHCPAELKLKYPLSMLKVAHFLFGEGDYAAYDALMAEMEAIILETGDERNYGEWMLESVYQVYPDLDAMQERVDMAASHINGHSRLVDPRSPFLFGSTSMFYCFHNNVGKADEEAAKFEKFINSYAELTGGHGQGADKLFRSELMCLRGELDSGELLACQAESIARVNNQFYVAVDAVLLQGFVGIYRLDTAGAESALKKLEEIQRDFPNNRDSAARRQQENACGMLAAMLGHPVAAAGVPKSSGVGPSSMMARLTEALHLIEGGKLRETAGMLEAFLTMDSRSCTAFYKHYVYSALAVCYLQLANVQKALNYMQSALDVSAPDGLFMTFAGSANVLDRILTLVEPAYTDAVAKIADIRARYMPEKAESEAAEGKAAASVPIEERLRNLPEPLTDREIEIASLAAQGMRNKEIAATLFLSERTVSNRLYTIFQKLNIDRRSELVDLLS